MLILRIEQQVIPLQNASGKKPSLGRFSVRVVQLKQQLKKADPVLISCYFVGYPERSKDYSFTVPHGIQTVEATTVKLCENSDLNGS